MRRTVTAMLPLLAIALLAQSGCEFRAQHSSYTYCDSTGCYSCDGWTGCQRIQDQAPTSAASGSACQTDEDCAAGDYCHPTSKQCLPSSICNTSSDCGVGMSCDARRTCVPGSGCADGGCPPTVTAVDPAKACLLAVDCGPGGNCVNGACQLACSSSASCGTGQTCTGGHCVATTPDPPGCAVAADCGSGSTCIDGTCHAGCAQASDCANPADSCLDGVCQPNLSRVPECKINADCAAGEECVNAACRSHCFEAADCGSCAGAPVCHLGYCMSQAEISPQCRSAADCTAGQSCVNGSCQ